MKQRNWKADIVMILLVLNLAVTAVIGVHLICASQETAVENEEGTLRASMQTGGKYTLYIGTNDKETDTQLISTEEARETVNAICARYVDGYTVSEAIGGYADETDTLIQEFTLIYTLNGATEEQVRAVMDEVLRALNQGAILVEYEQVKSAYYTGNGEQLR